MKNACELLDGEDHLRLIVEIPENIIVHGLLLGHALLHTEAVHFRILELAEGVFHMRENLMGALFRPSGSDKADIRSERPFVGFGIDRLHQFLLFRRQVDRSMLHPRSFLLLRMRHHIEYRLACQSTEFVQQRVALRVLQTFACLHILRDHFSFGAPFRIGPRQENLDCRALFDRLQFAERIGNLIQRIDIHRPIGAERQRVAVRQLEERYGGMAFRGENRIIRDFFDHCVRKKAVHLFLGAFPETLRDREIEEYLFAGRRIGDLEHDGRRIKKQPFQEIPLRLERRER